MKKLLALSLCLVIVFSLTGCGALNTIKDIQDAVEKVEKDEVDTPVVSDPIESETPVEQETPTQTEQPTQQETPKNSIEEEMQTVVDIFLKANINGVGLMDLVGIFNSDYELVEHVKYYNDSLLCKAMVKDSVFGNISKANTLTVDSVETLSRGVYSVAVKNDLGSDFNLNVIKVDGNYLIDISRLFISSNVKITAGAEAYLNGVKLSEDNFNQLDNYGGRIYTIPYLLAHIENTMTYATNYSESLNRGFIVDKVVEDAVDLRYHLTAEDLTSILPKTAELWTALHTAAKDKNTTGVSALLTDDSPLLVNTLVEGHQVNRLKLTVKQFEQRPESTCYLVSANRIALNLRSVFIGEYSFGTYTPSEFNWVVIDIQEDGSYKIYDASTNVWINGEINAFSDD